MCHASHVLPGLLMSDTAKIVSLPVTTQALGVPKMAHTRVLHVERGFHMSKNYAEQVMRDHCSITWVIEGQTIRDTTQEERLAMRAEQAEQTRMRELRQEILVPNEVSGLHFERPKTTNYRAPSREVYEGLELPLAVRVCRWPRRKAA